MSKVTLKQLAVVTVDALEKGQSVDKVAKQLAGLLIAERRSRDIAGLVRAVEKEFDRRGKVQVTVTSANKVDDATMSKLAQALDVKNPYFYEVIDQSVIGGVKASSLDKEIDLTVKGKLMQFKANLSK
jgi:F0F1-type ATP synthase delta subunit